MNDKKRVTGEGGEVQERAGEGRGGTGKGRGRDGEGSGRGVMARVGEGVRTMSWLILERNDLRRFQDILRNKIKKKKSESVLTSSAGTYLIHGSPALRLTKHKGKCVYKRVRLAREGRCRQTGSPRPAPSV